MKNRYKLEYIQKEGEKFECTKYEMEESLDILSLHKRTCTGDLKAIIRELMGRKD